MKGGQTLPEKISSTKGSYKSGLVTLKVGKVRRGETLPENDALLEVVKNSVI